MNNSKLKFRIGMLIGMPILFILIILFALFNETDDEVYAKFEASELSILTENQYEAVLSDKEYLYTHVNELDSRIALYELYDLLSPEISTLFDDTERALERYSQNVFSYKEAQDRLLNHYDDTKNDLILNRIQFHQNEYLELYSYYEEKERYLSYYRELYEMTVLAYEQFKKLQLAVIKLSLTEASLRNKVIELTATISFESLEDEDVFVNFIKELNKLKAEYPNDEARVVIQELEDFYRIYFDAIEIYKNFIEDL